MATIRSSRRTSRGRLILVIPALAVLVLALAAPGTVRGHSELVSADPAPSSVIPISPSKLVLFFSEAVDPASVRLRLFNSSQREIPLGPAHLDATGQVLTAAVPKLDPDTYTVDFAVVSAVDGHPTASLFAFLVDPTGSRPPPTPPVTEPTTPVDPGAVAARWAVVVAALLLVGTVLVWQVHRRALPDGGAVRPPWAWMAVVAGTGFAALVAHVLLAANAAYELTGSGGGVVGIDVVAPFGWTSYGIAMRVGLLALAVVLVVAIVSALRARRRNPSHAGNGQVALLTCGAGAVVTLLALSWTGHAASLGGPFWALVDAVHLLAIAAWFGALPAIGILAWQARGTSLGGREAARLGFRAHAPVALIAAPIVILTGLANSPLVVDESRELAASGYGNLLLAKALLVSVALGLGSANFFLARAQRRRPLFAIAASEVVIAALAIAVGTTMVSIQPATDRPPASVDPRLGVAHLYGEGGESRVHGIVDLPEPGVQSYSFAVSDAATGAGREDVAQVTLTFVPPPGSDLGSEVVLAEPAQQPWIWDAVGAYTPVVGTWTVDVEIRRGRLDADEVELLLPVRRVLHPTTLPPPTTGSQVLGTVAALTAPLPAGAVAWFLPIGLLAALAGVLTWERWRLRAGRAGGRAIRWLRIALVLAAVVAGASLTARDVVAAANRTPAIWEAAVNPLAGDPDAIAAGSEIYRANCTSCHGSTGAGDGPMAGDLVRPPGDLAAIVPYRLDGELAWTIGAGIAGTQMPAFGTTLLEDERWELVAYLRDQWPVAPE